MIEAATVEAVYKLVDDFTPGMRRIYEAEEKFDAALTRTIGKLDSFGLGASVLRTSKQFGEISNQATGVADKILGSFRRLDADLAPIFGTIGTKGAKSYEDMVFAAGESTNAILGKMGALGKELAPIFSGIKADGTGMFAGLGAGLTEEVEGIASNLSRITRGANRASRAVGKLKLELTGLAGADLSALSNIAMPSFPAVPASRAERAAIGAEEGAAASAAGGYGGRGPSGVGRARGRSHGSGLHYSRVGTELPGTGMHVSVAGNAALAVAGLTLGSIAEASEVADVLAKAGITGQLDMSGDFLHSPKALELAELIKKTSAMTGFSLKQSGEAFLGTERMLGGTDFDTRMRVMDTILPYAGLEAKTKEGTSLSESFESFIGLAHMTGEYRPDKLKDLAKTFAFTSINTNASLPQFEKTLSYSLPMLHNAMGMDAQGDMLMTMMAMNAGISSTKSGTWIRSFFEGLEPAMGDSKTAVKHNAELRKLGFLDSKNHTTWRKQGADGQTDWIASILGIASQLEGKLSHLPVDERMGTLKNVFGERGGGFAAVMANNNFVEQLPVFANKLHNFQGADKALEDYANNSPIMKAMQTFREFEIVLADVGDKLLPSVNAGLKDLSAILQALDKAVHGNWGDLGKLTWDHLLKPDVQPLINQLNKPGITLKDLDPSQDNSGLEAMRQGLLHKEAFTGMFGGDASVVDTLAQGVFKGLSMYAGGGGGSGAGFSGGVINASYGAGGFSGTGPISGGSTGGGISPLLRGAGLHGAGGGHPAFSNPYAGGAGGGTFVPPVGDHLTAGMRQNNLGNLGFFRGMHYAGLLGPSNARDVDHSIAKFATQEDGIRAAASLALHKYMSGRHDTWNLIAAAGGWTPGALGPGASVNVARAMGLSNRDDLHLDNASQMVKFLHGLAVQEHGAAGRFYSEERIRAALSHKSMTAGPPPTVSAPPPRPGLSSELMRDTGRSMRAASDSAPQMQEHHHHVYLDGKKIQHTVERRMVADNRFHRSVGAQDPYGRHFLPGSDTMDTA